MVDYGNAPFLWLVDRPGATGIGGNICDGTSWDESCPMSEALWRKFADWACEFDRTAFYSDDYDADDWDWIAFHAVGLQLARRLKKEVGEAYRVVYDKPCEDPNCWLDERTEILAGGKLGSLPSFDISSTYPVRFCQRIVSGGQTGADRAALDWAITHQVPHGGWCPKGRRAEDGRIPLKYQLTETEGEGYRARTVRNVRDSDATLIVNLGELEGGSLETQRIAERRRKPVRVVQADAALTDVDVADLRAWIAGNASGSLNVAGPRESRRPGIHAATWALLDRVFR